MCSRGLTSDPGVGEGELATDDDLIRLRPIELAAGLIALAEEVADEPLGALVQGLEVVEELGIGIPTEIKNWLDADLKCGIGRKREASYPRWGRSGGGAPEEPSPARLLLAICLKEEGKTRIFG